MNKGAGKRFTQSVASIYDKTYHTPKINKNYYDDSIVTDHVVTQGRKTFANLFSFNISDMPTVISVKNSLLI